MNAWIKRKNGPDEVVQIIPDTKNSTNVFCYDLQLAYEQGYLGRILFDTEGYWIYDGDILTIAEQEQLARFIIHHTEVIWNS